MTESILDALRMRAPPHQQSFHTQAARKNVLLAPSPLHIWQSQSQAEVAKIDRLRERQGSFSANRGIYLTQSVACKYS
jgi:hypothetical protein